jgi:DNA-binding PadR family transcriptional regulator
MVKKNMIKNIKDFQPEALLNSEKFRSFVEKTESEILRGISTLATLQIINSKQEEGIYGYELLKALESQTNKMLIVEEGTLYPLLRNLEKEELLTSERKKVGNSRERKYYFITPEGSEIAIFLSGFFAKLIESMGSLLQIEVNLPIDGFFYCPNCANKVDIINDPNIRFCEVCGLNIESYIHSNQNIKEEQV